MRNLVQELRDSGHQVRVTHYRRYIDWSNKIYLLNSLDPSFIRKLDFIAADIVELANHESPGLQYALPKGGLTVVEVITKDGNEYVGESICSDKEQFSRKLGTKIAASRIISLMKENQEKV